jgi:hypothetical protein
MRRPAITVRLGSGETGRAIVLRIESSERLALAPVTSAALFGAAILCAADAPPTLGGLSVVGYGLLAVALALLARLIRV